MAAVFKGFQILRRHLLIGAIIIIAHTTPAFSSNVTVSSKKPTIEWNVLDWRPAWILDGPMKGRGYADRIQALVVKRLTDYEHSYFVGNWARLDQTVTRPGVCFTAAFYNWPDENGIPRTDVIWSAPTILFFYHGIISRRDKLPALQKKYGPGPITLRKILQDTDLRFGAQPNRPFSKWIDPILARPMPHAIQRHGNRNLSEGMFDLLAAGRIDYFVDYYPMLQYRELSTSLKGVFAFTPIREHQGIFGLGSFSCARSPEGARAIKRINEVLAEVRLQDDFKAASSDWFMRSDNEEEFNRLWRTELLSRAH